MSAFAGAARCSRGPLWDKRKRQSGHAGTPAVCRSALSADQADTSGNCRKRTVLGHCGELAGHTSAACLHRSEAAKSLPAHSTDVEGSDGSVQAFEQELSGGLDSRKRLHRGMYFAIDENLAIHSFTAQARR